MDVFKEQNVERLQDSTDTKKKILITATAVSLSALMFFVVFMFFGYGGLMLALLLSGGALYGGYFLISNLYVEYEYILTNGEVDFDKIIAQRSRKRLATVKLQTATSFGIVKEDDDFGEAETLVCATANDPDQQDYYLRVKHKSLGDTVILFTPNEEMVDLITKGLPRELRIGR